MTYEPDTKLAAFLEKLKESVKDHPDYQVRIEPSDDGRGKSLFAAELLKKLEETEKGDMIITDEAAFEAGMSASAISIQKHITK